MAVAVVITSLVACGSPETQPTPNSLPESNLLPTTASPSGEYLTLNPVESSAPIYGGVLQYGFYLPRSFDTHQYVGYGPAAMMPGFNQLVMFDMKYKECVPETVIGDLAESWEMNDDDTEITFRLHQGIKWHDGVSFTADDVVYSLNKMTDPNSSAISNWFPAFQSIEKIDDNTVKIILKYASASFMVALAQGECQIQAAHLAGTNDQSADFIVGTGPFILDEYIPRVYIKWKRNQDYWKKDKNGNQLPYLDGLVYYQNADTDSVIARRLDLKSLVGSAASLDTYNSLAKGAPELLWQRRDRTANYPIFINLTKKPLDDIRVRRAMALVLNQEDLIVGFAGDAMFGITDSGILYPPDWGLPKEEIIKLMGWDKPYNERVAEAQALMSEAGYANGLKLKMVAAGTGSTASAGETMVFAEALRTKLNIDVEVFASETQTSLQQRLDENNYDTYTHQMNLMDPIQLKDFSETGGNSNWAKYSNPDLDKMLDELDEISDPEERREAVWAIERILLTDLPMLPTGCFVPTYLCYYPWVKNLRWNGISYSAINRVEDVWIDKSVGNYTPMPVQTPEPTPTTVPTPTSTSTSDNQTTTVSYDNLDWPVIWVSIDPPEGGKSVVVTVTLKVPPGSLCQLQYITTLGGRYDSGKFPDVIADKDGNAVIVDEMSYKTTPGPEGYLELTNIKPDGSKIVVTHPYTTVDK